MDNDNQQSLKKGSKFCRGYVGVWYGRRGTQKHADNYDKDEWLKVTDETIKNSLIKADLGISLDSIVTETFDNNECLNLFKNFNITATQRDINL